jgi:hypothetical protein
MSELEGLAASDSHAEPLSSRRPSALTTTALRTALQAQLRLRPTADGSELRRLACILAAESRRRSLRAEQLVVQLKQTWITLHEAGETVDRSQVWMIDRLISLCIEEYYRAETADR